MFVLPAATEATVPELLIVAVAGLELDHTPPNSAFDSSVVLFKQIEVLPVICGICALLPDTQFELLPLSEKLIKLPVWLLETMLAIVAISALFPPAVPVLKS